METQAKSVGIGVLLILGILIFIPLGTLFGGFAGWIIGFFFGDTILGIAAQLGIHDVTMFQLGVFFGFMGSFLRTNVTHR